MKNSWDGKTPDWELEPMATEQKEAQEVGTETAPSFAEARIAEIAKEAKEIPPENPEQKAVEVEAVRAEIAEMAKSERVKSSPEAVTEITEAPLQKNESAVNEFLGERAGGSLSGIERKIQTKEWANERKINKGFKKGVFAASPIVLGGLGAWIAAGAGIGTATTIVGVPLMSAVALASAPVSATILAGTGAVWGARRLWNAYKAKKATDELYA